MSVALGELGWSEAQFWDSTFRVLHAAQEGLMRKYEREQRADWERARWMATVIINPHIKKTVQPQQLMRFPWEAPEPMTPEELEEVANKLGRYIN